MNYEECVRNHRAYIIAEMSGNHGGSFQKAIEIVHAAAEAGADCLKTQTYTADTLTLNCDRPEFMIKGGLWHDRTLYDVYSQGGTPYDWQGQIKEECDKVGLDFMSTPFDKTAVDCLERIGCMYYKIASPELIDIPLIEYVARLHKTMFISTGMSTEEEIEEAVAVVEQYNTPYIIFKCCSQYPSEFKNMNLKTLKLMQIKFNCPIGLSDHSDGSLGAVASVSLGATVIEKHLCLRNDDESAVDAKFSMTPETFRQLVDDVHNTELMIGAAQFHPSQGELRGLANRRSLYVTKSMKAGEFFTEGNVKSVRPGKGLKPKYLVKVLGNKASCDIEFGTPLSWELIKEDMGGIK